MNDKMHRIAYDSGEWKKHNQYYEDIRYIPEDNKFLLFDSFVHL